MTRLAHAAKFSGHFFNRQGAVLFMLPVLVFSLFCASCQVEDEKTPTGPPEPPGQPTSGPGGAEYSHGAVNISAYGKGVTQYWIFEPASPTPASAPLIVFNHGWLAMNPQVYGAWIDHIVGKGNIVVYPRYQEGTTPAEETTQNAITAVKDAIQKLRSGKHIVPQLNKFAIVSHSLGGSISVNMAHLAASEGLPEPKAIMLAEPGHGAQFGGDILRTDLSSIPPTVLMLVVVGSEDTVVGSETGKRIFDRTPQIPLENRDFVTMVSDHYGEPPLLADHYAPVCPDDRYDVGSFGLQSLLRREVQKALGADVNCLDYYGFWKLFDALTDAAFYGKNREYALGNTSKQRFMGEWSNGEPIEELRVTDTP